MDVHKLQHYTDFCDNLQLFDSDITVTRNDPMYFQVVKCKMPGFCWVLELSWYSWNTWLQHWLKVLVTIFTVHWLYRLRIPIF